MIRPFVPSDTQAVVQLCAQLGYPSTAEDVEARLREVVGRAEHILLVAVVGQAIVGWAHVFITHHVVLDAYAELAGLVVDENHRGQGIGRLLLDRAEAWTREQGVHTLGLRSNVVRERAHRFYETAGYTCVKSQKAFFKQL